jgi:hypothetical protein
MDVLKAELAGPMRNGVDVARTARADRHHDDGSCRLCSFEFFDFQGRKTAQNRAGAAGCQRDVETFLGRQRPVVRDIHVGHRLLPDASSDHGSHMRPVE